MSERILRALMQLFAIIAQVDESNDTNEDNQLIKSSKAIGIIASFLRSEIREKLIEKYIGLFNDHLNTIHQKQAKKDGEKKRTSLNSVKVLRICSQINEELTQKQKVIVLIRIIEFIQSNENVTEQEIEFVNTVAEAFNIAKEEYDLITDFVLSSSFHKMKSNDVVSVVSRSNNNTENTILLDGLDDEIRILFLRSIHLLFFRYFGKEELSLNGQFIQNDRTHSLTLGATLHTQRSKSVYFSDVMSKYNKLKLETKLSFRTEKVSFNFRSGEPGLQPLDLFEESGNLVGIMGGSGTGKSTLINILNGNIRPSDGKVLINGIDLHKEKEKLQGIIGYVSQDDLLIEELSVFQNIYFNAKLCFGNLSERELKRKVIDVLYALGLYDIKDLVVGTPLEKTISGGQRKRLNIALELIREPEVLFVDEPTSGLSSRDSETIMNLLKDLTFRGKLVFVVIHQPSSDIFKLFDRLLILDMGGYPVFDGNPIDSVVYFKNHIHHGNAEERECALCGNVNPELIFNILDSKIVDEFGIFTGVRKITPKEWYKKYKKQKTKSKGHETKEIPKSNTENTGKINQFGVFFLRDILAKLSNRQYVLVTMLEAPVLAILLSFVVKFFNGPVDESGHKSYSFFLNENIPQYLFIAVVVALFLGLTVASEEIHKDRKILQRESFLNLSRGAYLSSKISILFIISAIQSILFVLIGNLILGINGMWLEYWLILFSTSCVANLMGLNISSAFDTAKVIYVIVPILIIPQLLFSGVIVKFDRLHPSFSDQTSVPVIGDLMPSRWAYEALAVVQTVQNEADAEFFKSFCKKSDAAWKKDYWYPEMKNQLELAFGKDTKSWLKKRAKAILVNEIGKEESRWVNLSCTGCMAKLNSGKSVSSQLKAEIEKFLEILKKQYTKDLNEIQDKIERRKQKMGTATYTVRLKNYSNEALSDQVSVRREAEKLIVTEKEILRKEAPIYNIDPSNGFFGAPFYSPVKFIGPIELSSMWANVTVLWIFVAFLWVSLYYDLLRKAIQLTNSFRERRFNRNKK
ncbi:MAG: ATP-binding cassette domain-containing protein [Bacteroidota bacterium]